MAYAPPGNQVGTGSLTHQATVYYDRRGLDKLKAMLRFVQVADPRPLPRGNGRTIQWYRFAVPAANTAPAVDGVIGSPLPLTSSTLSVTVEEYNDFTSSSQLLEDTDIAQFVEEMVDFMSYRAALTLDTLARTEVDSNTSVNTATQGAYFATADIRANVAKLQALNIMPWDGDNYVVVIHPYIAYDITSDNTAGGFIDVMKYANPMANVVGQAGALKGELGKIGGGRIVMTTNVGTSGSAPNVLYNSYIFGKGGLLMADLMGNDPDVIADPSVQRFRTFVTKGGPSATDPAGTTGTYAAYRFVTAFKTADSTNVRFKIVQADASLV